MIFLYFLFHFTSASVGDRTNWHKTCLSDCFQNQCNLKEITFPVYSFPFSPLPCSLQCKSDCIEFANQNIQIHWNKTVQFYGKWPFKRIGNCEEIASVVFSLGNCIFTVIGYWMSIQRHRELRVDYYHKLVTGQCVISTITWLCSAQFHARDTFISERLDYFGAGAMIFYSLYLTLHRNFIRYTTYLRSTILGVYCWHVARLWTKFDYGLNMKICIIFGIGSVVFWVRIFLIEREKHLFRIAALTIFTSALLLLEVFDFPPIWGVFDAHSIWHLVTMPLPLFLYEFIYDDVLYLQKIQRK